MPSSSLKPKLSMRRILMNQRSQRVQQHFQMEPELVQLFHDHGVLNMSDIMNVALEKYFREQGWLTD